MVIPTFYIKVNDLQPFYYVQIKDGSGVVVDITSATIRCTMKSIDGTLKINRQTTGISISDATNGQFYYAWQSGDTDTIGKYYIEFEITPASGGKWTIPASPKERAEVFVEPSLDTI